MIARTWRGWTTPENADAVVPPEARVLLLRHDERSRHYDIVHEPS